MFVLVGGTYTVDCPTLEVCLLLVAIPLTSNVGHAGGFPPSLEGTDATGTEGFPPVIESIG